ncbi:hypothetical protein [Brazilian marseillevirus]|uniref:hypothetical protein n=1 Tax=Brazilian marseillevirus TaxID=1813599 RepID=UPI00078107C1|nr:hypothetical protein A3303_gp179 [Brazilian marseillevirus]AMQ10687.1 hypothetical protein [Brazilian marseillevirus]
MQKFLEREEIIPFVLSSSETLPKKEDFLRLVKARKKSSFDEYFVLPNGQKHGKSTRKFLSGEILTGEWKEGKLHGKWKCSLGSDYISGNFWEGKANGIFRSETTLDGFRHHSSGNLRKKTKYIFLNGLLQSEEASMEMSIGGERLFGFDQPKRHFFWDMKKREVMFGDVRLTDIRETSGIYTAVDYHLLSENHLLHFLKDEGNKAFATMESGEIVRLCIPIFF